MNSDQALEAAQAVLAGSLPITEADIISVIWLSILLNLVGVVVCYVVARSRGSPRVAFWTTMGLLFGPFAIPFVLWSTRTRSP